MGFVWFCVGYFTGCGISVFVLQILREKLICLLLKNKDKTTVECMKLNEEVPCLCSVIWPIGLPLYGGFLLARIIGELFREGGENNE